MTVFPKTGPMDTFIWVVKFFLKSRHSRVLSHGNPDKRETLGTLWCSVTLRGPN